MKSLKINISFTKEKFLLHQNLLPLNKVKPPISLSSPTPPSFHQFQVTKTPANELIK